MAAVKEGGWRRIPTAPRAEQMTAAARSALTIFGAGRNGCGGEAGAQLRSPPNAMMDKNWTLAATEAAKGNGPSQQRVAEIWHRGAAWPTPDVRSADRDVTAAERGSARGGWSRATYPSAGFAAGHAEPSAHRGISCLALNEEKAARDRRLGDPAEVLVGAGELEALEGVGTLSRLWRRASVAPSAAPWRGRYLTGRRSESAPSPLPA